MHLVEISLRNWRSYRNAQFHFPKPVNGRNMVLIGAQNGTGKTSLLIGLYLGLFGREAVHLIEGVRLSNSEERGGTHYRELLERTLHIPARSTEDPYASVSLKFETSQGDVSIVRRWNFARGGRVRDLNSRDGEEVRSIIGGKPKVYSTWQDANAHISELLFPSNVMPCFFFDGEQAQARVEATGGRALLDAVNALYGTGLLDQLSQSLRTFIQNEATSLKREIGVVKEDELAEKRAQLERLRDQVVKVAEALADKRKQRDDADREREKATNEVYQLVGDSSADVEEYAGTIRALENELNEIRQQLTAAISGLSLPLAASRLGLPAISIVRAEQVRDRWLLIREEAIAKASKIVDSVFPEAGPTQVEPPLTAAQTMQLRSRLEKELETLWSPPPEGCAQNYKFQFLSTSDRGAVLAKIERARHTLLANVAELAGRWSAASARLRETERKFETLRSIQPRLVDLKAAVQRASARVRDLDGEIGSLSNQETALNAQMKDLRAAIGQMEKKQTAAGPVQQKLEVAHRVRSVIDEAKEQLMPLCRSALEQRCTHHFQKMVSREFDGFSARFDPDSEPRLESKSGRVRYVTTGLSGAQKRAFGLAFTLAVADVSGQPAPIVIDTPVGNMDSQYRDRVLRYIGEAARGQVILLTHDEEITEEYRQKLNDRINANFLVGFKIVEEGAGESTVHENRYFGDPSNE
jgi:DNA sulfur modification protein DndD